MHRRCVVLYMNARGGQRIFGFFGHRLRYPQGPVPVCTNLGRPLIHGGFLGGWRGELALVDVVAPLDTPHRVRIPRVPAVHHGEVLITVLVQGLLVLSS